MTSIDTKPRLLEKRGILLTTVQDAVVADKHNLYVFGRVLEKVTGNVLLAKGILRDYGKSMFRAHSPSEQDDTVRTTNDSLTESNQVSLETNQSFANNEPRPPDDNER